MGGGESGGKLGILRGWVGLGMGVHIVNGASDNGDGCKLRSQILISAGQYSCVL